MEKICVEDIFQEASTSAVDFEITLAALLASILIWYPDAYQPFTALNYLVAFSLLFCTLIRRMAIINQYYNRTGVFRRTAPILVLATVYFLFHLSVQIGVLLSEYLFIEAAIISVIFLPILSVGLLVFYELVFGEMLFFAAVVLYNRFLDTASSPFLNRIFHRVISICLETTAVPYDKWPDQLLKYDNGEYVLEREMNIWQRVGSILGITLAIVLFAFLSLVGLGAGFLVNLGNPVLNLFVGASLSFSAFTTDAFTRLLYARYGHNPSGHRFSVKQSVIAILLVIFLWWIYASNILYENLF